MKEHPADSFDSPSEDVLLGVLSALASPHRLRIIAALETGGRQYVSRLARQIGMSRPLLIMHLQRLEAANLVSSNLELSSDGKAMKYYEVTPFALQITPARIAEAARASDQEQPGVSELAIETEEDEDQ
ncbi:MAG: winged helix-turn-helix domain-containing protein [Dehalococcoidia bacterium]